MKLSFAPDYSVEGCSLATSLASSLNCVYIQYQTLSIEQDLKLGGECHELEP